MKKLICLAILPLALMACGGGEFTPNVGLPLETDSEVPDHNTTEDSIVGNDAIDAGMDAEAAIDSQEAATETEAPDADAQQGCTPGTMECQGKVPRSCDQNGVWQEGSPCDFLCDKGVCKGDCVPGTNQCVDYAETKHCDANGQWQVTGSCPNECDGDTCNQKWCCSEANICNCEGKTQCETGQKPKCTGTYTCCYTPKFTGTCYCATDLGGLSCTDYMQSQTWCSNHTCVQVTSCP